MHTPGDGQAGERGRLLAGRYRVTRQLGRGGMGVVCRAYDEVLGRDVAVKELRTFSDAAAPELADFRLRMQREARAAARVRHPGVIAVHDIAEHEGRPVIVMELVDGPSLDDVLRDRGTLDPAEAADMGAKVLEALAAAHRAGVLHRDVKPGNILLEHGGRVVLTDFGIAAVEEPGDGAATHLTRSGELVGSLDYLAPERARGEDPGPPSDVWSLGATLYASLEGGSPFRRTSTWSTLTAIVAEPLPEPRNAGPLAPALRALLEKDPAGRPDAAAAAAMLRRVAGGAPGAGAADTMQLGAVRSPRPPAAPTSQGHHVPVPGGVHSAPTGDVSARADRDTDRSTLSTRRGHERRRRRTVVAASVAAVLLAGAGVAWGVTALGPEGHKEPAAAAAASKKPSGSQSPEEKGDRAGDGAGEQSPGTEASASASAAPEETRAPAAGGPAGGEDGNGGTSGGGDGGGGGTDGGATGGDDSGGGTDGGTSGGSEPEPAPVCHPIGGGKYNCQVWQAADSYDDRHQKVGTLYGGTNYFFCQSNLGYRETSGQWTNTWWAKTDDDSGNANVWVSVVYIEGGDNDQPVPGLPTC